MLPLEREFRIHAYRHHLAKLPRDLLEQQFLMLLEEYLALCDYLEIPADDRCDWPLPE